MKNKFISAFSVGILAVAVVAISDIVAMLSLGNFAWIAFVLWNFTAKASDDTPKNRLLVQMLLAIPIGLLLAICMIHIPTLFGNNNIIKYLVTFYVMVSQYYFLENMYQVYSLE